LIYYLFFIELHHRSAAP